MSRLGPWAAVVAAVALAILAFVIPAVASARADEPEPRAAELILRDVRHASDIPPLRLSIVAANIAYAGTEPQIVSARVRWHTIFNVPFGTSEIDGQSHSYEWAIHNAVLPWALFLLAEAGLLAAAVVPSLRT